MHYAINNNWIFNPEFKNENINTLMSGQEIMIPHTVKELPLNYFDEKTYQFVSCYRKAFDLKKAKDISKDQSYVLYALTQEQLAQVPGQLPESGQPMHFLPVFLER